MFSRWRRQWYDLGMKKDESVGVVPAFKEGGEYKFLLIHHEIGYWAFPKGHSAEGESTEETVKRELYEETGITDINIDFDKKFFEKYVFERNDTKFDKIVTYFLGFIGNEEIKEATDPTDEIKEVRLVTYDEAIKLLTFEEARGLLREVSEYLTKRGVV